MNFPTDFDCLEDVIARAVKKTPSGNRLVPRRTHSPFTGKPYPKCSYRGCENNVYAEGECYLHHQWTASKRRKTSNDSAAKEQP